MTEVFNRAITLMEKIKETGGDFAETDLADVEKCLCSGADYYNAVIKEVVRMEEVRINYAGDPERIQYATETLDAARRNEHKTLTRSVNYLNTLAETYGVEPIFDTGRVLNDEEAEDREFAAVLMYQFTNEMYLDEMVRSNRYVSEATYKAVDEALYKMAEDAKKMHKETMYNTDLKVADRIKEMEGLDEQKTGARKPHR